MPNYSYICTNRKCGEEVDGPCIFPGEKEPAKGQDGEVMIFRSWVPTTFTEFNSVDRRLFQKCPKCGADALIDIVRQGQSLNVAASGAWPLTMREFTGQPIEVTSRKHFNDLCRQYGKVEVDRTIADRLPKAEIPQHVGTQRVTA